MKIYPHLHFFYEWRVTKNILQKAKQCVVNVPVGRHGSMAGMAQDAANLSETERERKMEESGTLWRDQASDGQGSERGPKGHNTDSSGKEDHGKEVRRKERGLSLVSRIAWLSALFSCFHPLSLSIHLVSIIMCSHLESTRG